MSNKNKKTVSDPSYMYKRSEIEAIKEQAKRDGINEAFAAMLCFPLIVMRDKYGYGEKRLNRFIGEVVDQYDSFMKGYVTMDDIYTTLKEERDISIKDVDKEVKERVNVK